MSKIQLQYYIITVKISNHDINVTLVKINAIDKLVIMLLAGVKGS